MTIVLTIIAIVLVLAVALLFGIVGYKIALKINVVSEPVKNVPEELTDEEELKMKKRQKYIDNFYSYDGTEQS